MARRDYHNFRGHLGKIPKASLDTPLQTTMKVARNLKYQNQLYKLGLISSPKVSNIYKKVITKQYPKYTGPKAPYTGIGGGTKNPFTVIPKGYLQNEANKKAIAARTGSLSKNIGTAFKIGKAASITAWGYEAGKGIYKGTKRALGPGGTEFHTKKSKNKYGTKGY
tara:strand:- start:65 stop:562 length:498 start_codon:yes stop_codon:yes gene_type:complete